MEKSPSTNHQPTKRLGNPQRTHRGDDELGNRCFCRWSPAHRTGRKESGAVFARCAPLRERWGFQGSFQNPLGRSVFFFKILDGKIGGLEWLLLNFVICSSVGCSVIGSRFTGVNDFFEIDPEAFRRLPKPLNHRISARNCWSMCADCLRRRRDSWLVLDGLTPFEQA